MKYLLFPSLLAVVCAQGAYAQAAIYRCGNEYTNAVSEAQKSQCKLVEGGNVTVVQGFRPPPASAQQPVKLVTASPTGAPRVDSADQRARDSDARLILESELKKSEARHGELQREYNNGETDKRGDEARNYQKYIDRVADLKANLARNESDMAGIRRELTRIPAAK